MMDTWSSSSFFVHGRYALVFRVYSGFCRRVACWWYLRIGIIGMLTGEKILRFTSQELSFGLFASSFEGCMIVGEETAIQEIAGL